jgi:hypothetical protein
MNEPPLSRPGRMGVSPPGGKEGGVLNVEVDGTLTGSGSVPRNAVVALFSWIVAGSKANLVRSDHPMVCLHKAGNHLWVEIGPRRLPVEKHHEFSVPRPFVDAVHV